MSSLVGQSDDDLQHVSVDRSRIEVLEPDLRSPEHLEGVAIHLAPGEVEEPVAAAAVHDGPPNRPPRTVSSMSAAKGWSPGVLEHDLLLTLQARVHVGVPVRLVG